MRRRLCVVWLLQRLTLWALTHSIIDYDKIVVLDHGRLAEQGSPAALLAKADAQVAELAARFASERSATCAPIGGAPGCGASVQHRAVPDGCVSRAFAEEKWAEREAEFTRQLEQLQSLVADAQQQGQTPSEAHSGCGW